MARRETRHLPQTAAELNAEWFTSAVGAKYGGVVIEVETEVIGEGVGFMGELHRCNLTWEGGDAAPRSVIAKLHSKVAKNRSIGEGLDDY